MMLLLAFNMAFHIKTYCLINDENQACYWIKNNAYSKGTMTEKVNLEHTA